VIAPPAPGPQDRVEHGLKLLADVFDEEPHDEVAVLLQQVIPPEALAVA
jgi:hypothetical protein